MRLCCPLSSVYSVMKTNRARLFLLLRRLDFHAAAAGQESGLLPTEPESKRVQCQRQEDEALRAQCENLQREEFKG